jgi:hypothetical protein
MTTQLETLMKNIVNFFREYSDYFTAPEFLLALVLLVVSVLCFVLVDLPNIQECQAHGFTLRFCVTQLR